MFGDFNLVIDIRSLAIFSAYVLLVLLLWNAQRNTPIKWVDMITSSTNKISLTKFLQLVGGITGTWIMVVMTVGDRLTTELFTIYLTYVGAIEGWSKYVAAKYNIRNDDPKKKDTQS